MTLSAFWVVVRASWIVLLAGALLGLAAGASYALAQTPLYTSRSKVFVSTSATDNVADLLQGSSFAQQRVRSYADLAVSPSVLVRVIKKLKLGVTPYQLAANVSATVPLNEVIIEIAATDGSPIEAKRIADETASALSAVVAEIEKPSGTGASPVKVSTIQPGILPQVPSSPKILQIIVLGFFLGVGLALLSTLVRQKLDRRLRSPEDIQVLSESPILGAIFEDPSVGKTPLIVHVSPQSSRAEAFRQLRANLQFALAAEQGKMAVVTSATPSDGKSTIAANLAISLALDGKKALLLDGDLRRPKVHKLMGLEGSVGLTSVLLGEASLADVLQSWGGMQLDVLPAGRIPPNPSELLGSAKMTDLLNRLLKLYDVIIVDAPPVLAVSDPLVLASQIGTVVVVASLGASTKPQIRATILKLATLGIRPLGFVLNRVPTKGAQKYQYSYSYNYGYSQYGEYSSPVE